MPKEAPHMRIIKRHISTNHGGKRAKTDGVVFHSTGSAKATSQFGWFNNPKAKASSNLHIANDGTTEEYVPDHLTSWANGQGNARLVAIETQGDGTTPWTEAQLDALAHLAADLHRKYGFPLRLMANSKKSERGLGYHRLGVPRSRWGVGVWLVAGGERWSSAVGKVCPGDKRIAQMPEVLRRAKALVADKTPVEVPKAVAKPKAVKPPAVTVLTVGSRGAKVKKLQRGLNRVFPTYRSAVKVNRGRLLRVDGVYGETVEAWVAEFQRRAGLFVDGVCGPLTQAALKRYGIKI